jgi:hypothetical protein
MKRETKIVLLLALVALVLNIVSYARQQSHADHENHSNNSAGVDDVAIFCPTMKTGQLCSHGTSNVLGLTGANQEKWMEVARKYNKTVDAATLQLFKDAEGVLTPAQLTQLKAWFAVGLNPQINELLYSKGLGPKKN